MPLTSLARQVKLSKRTRRPAVGASESGHKRERRPRRRPASHAAGVPHLADSLLAGREGSALGHHRTHAPQQHQPGPSPRSVSAACISARVFGKSDADQRNTKAHCLVDAPIPPLVTNTSALDRIQAKYTFVAATGCVDAATTKFTDDGSAVPRSIADPSASVWLAKSGIAIFYIINVDCAERGLRLL